MRDAVMQTVTSPDESLELAGSQGLVLDRQPGSQNLTLADNQPQSQVKTHQWSP